MRKLPVTLSTGEKIRLSPGEHSVLIKAIIEEFAPRFQKLGMSLTQVVVAGALALSSRFQQREEGVPRRPGGPPHLGELLP